MICDTCRSTTIGDEGPRCSGCRLRFGAPSDDEGVALALHQRHPAPALPPPRSDPALALIAAELHKRVDGLGVAQYGDRSVIDRLRTECKGNSIEIRKRLAREAFEEVIDAAYYLASSLRELRDTDTTELLQQAGAIHAELRDRGYIVNFRTDARPLRPEGSEE